jgi:hypothetical protein
MNDTPDRFWTIHGSVRENVQGAGIGDDSIYNINGARKLRRAKVHSGDAMELGGAEF